MGRVLLSVRTAGWLGLRLGGPALRETYRSRRARRR